MNFLAGNLALICYYVTIYNCSDADWWLGLFIESCRKWRSFAIVDHPWQLYNRWPWRRLAEFSKCTMSRLSHHSKCLGLVSRVYVSSLSITHRKRQLCTELFKISVKFVGIVFHLVQLVENNFVKTTFGERFPGGGILIPPWKRPRIDTGRYQYCTQ